MPSQFLRSQSFWKTTSSQTKELIIDSIWNGREGSTVAKYCLSLRKFLKFLDDKSYPPKLPFCSMIAAEYLTYLKINKATKGAIECALNSLKWIHCFVPGVNKSNNPMMDEFLAKISNGISRDMGKPTTQKSPLSGEMVAKLISKSDMGNLTDLRNCLLVSFAYNLLLRHDEFSHINLSHISESESGFKILIPKSKTDKFRNGKHVFLSKCPDRHSPSNLLVCYLERIGLRIGMNHFLFCPLKRNGISWKPINQMLAYTSFRDIVKSSVERIGLDSKKYGTHSLRAGGASDLAPHVSEHELLVSGRWADPRSIRSYVELKDSDRYELNTILQNKISQAHEIEAISKTDSDHKAVSEATTKPRSDHEAPDSEATTKPRSDHETPD